ncbi:MAG: hypothetical protein IPP17_30455 [Bacteroidetes bacterium]|nr:hypothetical protein [Bacteroidota bacterium]
MSALLLAFVLVFGATNSLFAQVASPHNFPHAYGFLNTGQYGPQTMRSYHAMGMNGHVVFSPIATFNFDHYVLNKQMDQYMSWAGNISGPNVIQKNSHIWLSNTADSRVCTVDTMGIVLNQLKITNSNLVQMVADTNDHIYLVYKATSTTGFGVVRFGASFVPDWHNFYPGADPVEAFWGNRSTCT